MRTKTGKPKNQQFNTLIHNCQFENWQPALGQYSVGKVGQYSVGTNILGHYVIRVLMQEVSTTTFLDGLSVIFGQLQ